MKNGGALLRHLDHLDTKNIRPHQCGTTINRCKEPRRGGSGKLNDTQGKPTVKEEKDSHSIQDVGSLPFKGGGGDLSKSLVLHSFSKAAGKSHSLTPLTKSLNGDYS